MITKKKDQTVIMNFSKGPTEDEDLVDLVYDSVLDCYYDPKTNNYYDIKK